MKQRKIRELRMRIVNGLVGVMVVALCGITLDKSHSHPNSTSSTKAPTKELAKLHVSSIMGNELTEGEKRYLQFLLPKHGATVSPKGGELHFLPCLAEPEPDGSMLRSCEVWYIEENNRRFKIPFESAAGPHATIAEIERDFAEQAVIALGKYYHSSPQK